MEENARGHLLAKKRGKYLAARSRLFYANAVGIKAALKSFLES